MLIERTHGNRALGTLEIDNGPVRVYAILTVHNVHILCLTLHSPRLALRTAMKNRNAHDTMNPQL
jgi:hypothetical protein